MTAHAGELFARIDSPWQIFLKGFAGLGRTAGGGLNDEDWGLSSPPFAAFVPYSNTLSDVDERIRYAIVDIGYDW
jgi:hypothetical protein